MAFPAEPHFYKVCTRSLALRQRQNRVPVVQHVAVRDPLSDRIDHSSQVVGDAVGTHERVWLAQPTADIDATDEYGWTLLHRTCLGNTSSAGRVALAKYLLSRGADVNRRDRRRDILRVAGVN